MMFPTSYEDILAKIDVVDPVKYGKTRNFVNGAVTYLSPYISRGVISTKQVLKAVLDKNYDPFHIEKFIQELAWRDYWQQVWKHKLTEINHDLKNTQAGIENRGIPTSIVNGDTGITAIDLSLIHI